MSALGLIESLRWAVVPKKYFQRCGGFGWGGFNEAFPDMGRGFVGLKIDSCVSKYPGNIE